MRELDINTLEREYPSVDLAYPLAVASYEVANKRLETVEAKIQTLLAVVISFSVGVFAFGATQKVNFRSGWFIAAMACFVFSVGIGFYARVFGVLRVISPMNMYTTMLDLSEWEFKKSAIYYAGIDFEANKTLVSQKWQTGVYALLAFIFEVVLVVVWAVAARF